MVQNLHPYMTTGKNIALMIWTFVSKVMSLLFNMLSRIVITFLPRSKHLLILWLQSPSAVILEPKKIVCLEHMSKGLDKVLMILHFVWFSEALLNSVAISANAGDGKG